MECGSVYRVKQMMWAALKLNVLRKGEKRKKRRKRKKRKKEGKKKVHHWVTQDKTELTET